MYSHTQGFVNADLLRLAYLGNAAETHDTPSELTQRRRILHSRRRLKLTPMSLHPRRLNSHARALVTNAPAPLTPHPRTLSVRPRKSIHPSHHICSHQPQTL
ncbi:MAG: hypothetical protein MJ100_04875 [Ruminococcus sp.]|nr:hypothetical protein [Ruminococcus sp.]